MKRKVPVLLILLCLAFTMEALASDAKSVADKLINSTEKFTIVPQPDEGTGKVFPEKLDLREKGVVTPVKLQNPFGTCWGFSAIAAAETSILSKAGKTYEETGLDLSEHQVAWFAKTPLSIGSVQDGEGCHVTEGTDPMNIGGWIYTCTSVFSSGIGPSLEERFPYRGHEGRMDVMQFDSFTAMPVNYSENDDWSIDEAARFHQDYTLLDSKILDDPAIKVYDQNETEYLYIGYSAAATEQIKQELSEGRAVSIAFCADDYMPGVSSEARYLNDNWCHYTYDNGIPNHAVTIVGWDDTIPASGFLDHSQSSEDGLRHQPEGDGAWIVKNSWGAATNEFPNKSDWGLPDENGKSSGYFYLSYYDHSISIPEVMDFKETINDIGFIIDEYDFMPSEAESPQGWTSEGLVKSSNVYCVDVDQILESVSVDTAQKNESVHIEVYLLNEGYTSPEDGQLKAELDEFFEFKGYHRVNLQEGVRLKNGQSYSIVVTKKYSALNEDLYEVSSASAMNEMGMLFNNLMLPEDQQLNYYCKGIVNPGESFIYMEEAGGWTDWSEVIQEFQNTVEMAFLDFDNFSIKGYSSYENKEEGLAMVHSVQQKYEYPEAIYSYEQYQQAAKRHVVKQLTKKALIILLILLAATVLIVILAKKRKKKKMKQFAGEEEASDLAQMNQMAEPQTDQADCGSESDNNKG